MDDLKDRFHVRAVNLFRIRQDWSPEKTQSLDDQAGSRRSRATANADEVYLVGHSFSGSVAMKVAARLAGRIAKQVVLEANPYLLAQFGRADAFAEAMDVRNASRDSERLANGRLRSAHGMVFGVSLSVRPRPRRR